MGLELLDDLHHLFHGVKALGCDPGSRNHLAKFLFDKGLQRYQRKRIHQTAGDQLGVSVQLHIRIFQKFVSDEIDEFGFHLCAPYSVK